MFIGFAGDEGFELLTLFSSVTVKMYLYFCEKKNQGGGEKYHTLRLLGRLKPFPQ